MMSDANGRLISTPSHPHHFIASTPHGTTPDRLGTAPHSRRLSWRVAPRPAAEPPQHVVVPRPAAECSAHTDGDGSKSEVVESRRTCSLIDYEVKQQGRPFPLLRENCSCLPRQRDHRRHLIVQVWCPETARVLGPKMGFEASRMMAAQMPLGTSRLDELTQCANLTSFVRGHRSPCFRTNRSRSASSRVRSSSASSFAQ